MKDLAFNSKVFKRSITHCFTNRFIGLYPLKTNISLHGLPKSRNLYFAKIKFINSSLSDDETITKK